MVLAVAILICGIGCFSKDKKVQLGILIGSLFLLLVHLPIGRDIPTYIEALENLPSVPTFGQGRFFFIDWWYSVFNWLFHSPEMFLFIINGITTVFIGFVIYKYSKNYALSLFLVLTSGLFAVYMQSAIRQGLAMAVLLFAIFQFLLKGKYGWYGLTIVLMATFHDVALLGLVLIPLHYFSHLFSYKVIVILLVVAACIGLTMGYVFEWIYPYFGYFGMYLSSYSISIAGIGLQIVNFGLICFGMIMVKPKDEVSHFLFLINALSFGIYLVLMGYPAASRICDYFQVVNIIFIPSLFLSMVKPSFKYLFIGLTMVLNLVLYQSDLNNILYNDSTNVSIVDVPYFVYGLNNCEDIMNLQGR